MNNILSIVEVVLAFSFMIAIHEGGHYLVCRLFGVDVDEFALGFGPTLFSRKWGKTLYAIRAVPLGGFCKPKGGDLSGETAEKMYEKPPEPGDFLYASWWKRIFIFLAGPGMNLLSAFVLYFLIAWIVGDKAPMEKPILGYMAPQSAAQVAGLQEGDHLLKVDGQVFVNLYRAKEDILEKLDKDPKKGVVLTLDRKGQVIEKVLKGDLKDPQFELGIDPQYPTIIGSPPPSSPARKAGLQEGDQILSVDGTKVSKWMQMTDLIHHSTTDDIRLEVSRGGRTSVVTLKKIYDGMGKHIGLSPPDAAEFDTRPIGLSEALSQSSLKIATITVRYAGALWQMVTGKINAKDSLGGPLTIMRFMYQQASLGWEAFANIVAFISLILCIMNLLPIPVVDGGQIVLCFVEGLKRKAVPVKIQMAYQQVGFVLVVGLMLFAVVMDFWNLYLEKFQSQIH